MAALIQPQRIKKKPSDKLNQKPIVIHCVEDSNQLKKLGVSENP
jgi:hypothetical protein